MIKRERGSQGESDGEDGREVNSFARHEKIKGIDSTCQLRKSSLENTH